MEFVPIVNQVSSFFTVVGQVMIVLLLIFLFILLNGREYRFTVFFAKHALVFGFISALGGMAVSLFYSEVAGYAPCNLCWFQRIFLYPQVVLLGMALWKKDARVADYSIALSFIGAIIAVYHSYIQYGGSPLIPCSAAGVCSQRFVFEYGYITIPVMALTAFVFIIFIMYMQKIYERRTL